MDKIEPYIIGVGRAGKSHFDKVLRDALREQDVTLLSPEMDDTDKLKLYAKKMEGLILPGDGKDLFPLKRLEKGTNRTPPKKKRKKHGKNNSRNNRRGR